VGSLSELAADLVHAVRCPLPADTEAHAAGPVLRPPVEPGLSGCEGEALEMRVLVRPH